MTEADRMPREAIDKAEAVDIAALARELGAVWKGEAIDNRGTACPGCGGVDRFSVDRKKNLFFCRASGAGGGPIELVMHVRSVGFRAAVAHLTGKAALPPREAAPKAEKDDHFREEARLRGWKIWQRGRPALRLVPAYLAKRGIDWPDWRIPALREIDDLPCGVYERETRTFRVFHRGPAMLAAITAPDGHFIGVHRTWIDLSRPNGKALIADPETGEIMPSKKVEGSQRGGIVALRPKGARPALWCALNKDNIAGKAETSVPHPSRTIRDSLGRERRAKVQGPVPDLSDTRCLPPPAALFSRAVMLGDGDSDAFETQAAMLRAERRFVAAGMAAITDWAPAGKDWNDALMTGEAPTPFVVSGGDVVIGEGIETTLAWAQFRDRREHADMGACHDGRGGAGRAALPIHGEMR